MAVLTLDLFDHVNIFILESVFTRLMVDAVTCR
jgi:hypothetical protein